MRMQFKPGVAIEEDGVSTASIRLTLKRLTPSIRAALAALEEGENEDSLIEQIKNEDELTLFFYYLDLFKKHALLT